MIEMGQFFGACPFFEVCNFIPNWGDFSDTSGEIL